MLVLEVRVKTVGWVDSSGGVVVTVLVTLEILAVQ